MSGPEAGRLPETAKESPKESKQTRRGDLQEHYEKSTTPGRWRVVSMSDEGWVVMVNDGWLEVNNEW